MERIEGRIAVLAALQARLRRFQVVLVRQGLHEESCAEVLSLAAERGVPVRHVAREELDQLARGSTHGGIIALATPRPRLGIEDIDAWLVPSPPPLLLLLEGVDDARNLGFTIRSAEALGASAVLVKRHLWDFDAEEVARPASGAYERLPIVQVERIEDLAPLRRRGVQFVGCLAGVRRTIHDLDLRGATLLAIGGEKRGLSGALRDVCDAFATIPSVEGASSLPLSHAAAIALAEARRQRLAHGAP